MRLLLDTHVAIWAATGAPTLPSRWLDEIENGADEVAVSVASLWEIAIKNSLDERRGSRFDLTFDQAVVNFEEGGYRRLPISIEAMREVEQMPRHHGDPFDRLIVATAVTDGWRLLTHDRQLTAYGPAVILL